MKQHPRVGRRPSPCIERTVEKLNKSTLNVHEILVNDHSERTGIHAHSTLARSRGRAAPT